ncbi:MAG: hypothetical protein EP312_02315 [Gammaproteobacteria bacterium]|nr:MAG: hypothetical protein EP312_02315 [Gammaproteobacteria bacterium]
MMRAFCPKAAWQATDFLKSCMMPVNFCQFGEVFDIYTWGASGWMPPEAGFPCLFIANGGKLLAIS